jgi:hypothetical protein
MCANSATHGLVENWHLRHLGKFAHGAAHRHIGVPTKWTYPT